MDKSDIIYIYGRIVINIAINLILVCLIVSKRKYFPVDIQSVLKIWLDTGKNRYYSEIGIRLSMAILLFGHIITGLDYFKDIPYINNKEFEIITGIIDSGDHSRDDRNRRRYVSIVQEGTNQKIRVSFFDTYVTAGEKITIICLPNSKFGTRIQEDKIN